MLHTVVWEQCSMWPMQSFVQIVDVCVVMLGSGEAYCMLTVDTNVYTGGTLNTIITVWFIDSFQRQLLLYQPSTLYLRILMLLRRMVLGIS